MDATTPMDVGPRPTERARERVSETDLAAVGAFVVALIVYVRTLLPGVSVGDWAEAQMVPSQLGILHPTGYPLYTIVGALFSLIPVETVAYRANLLSAVAAAGAVGGHGPDRRSPRRPSGDRLRGRARPGLHGNPLAGSDLLRDERSPPVPRRAAAPPGTGLARRTARSGPPHRRAARRTVRLEPRPRDHGRADRGALRARRCPPRDRGAPGPAGQGRGGVRARAPPVPVPASARARRTGRGLQTVPHARRAVRSCQRRPVPR